jgi:uncharacterized protein (TIGR03437 family)
MKVKCYPAARAVSLAATILLSAAAVPVAQAQVIAAWTFENSAIALNNTPAPSTGSGTAKPLGMDLFQTATNIGITTADITQGSTGDTGTNGAANLSQIWRVRAVPAAGLPSTATANGWSSAAPIGTQGAMFSASTVGYTNITVSFDWYATNQGEAKLQLQYTTDGANWTNVPVSPGSAPATALLNNKTSVYTVKGWYVMKTGGTGQSWSPGMTATISDPAAANNPKFAIQMVNAATGVDCINVLGTALNNSSGNWRFDNVTISGQSTFTGFTPGNLVLSRSVYTGDASSVVKGQALPPLCPASANISNACGNKATDNGLYASTTSASNIFNNNLQDGSFGITSPIFLEQLTPAGATVNSIPIPSNMIVTSFSSKSELALNLSTDGSVITFMGYVAAPNTVDVSNSNTPGVYDPGNPAGGSYYRAIAQVGANGAVQVTPTNAYSGNNGRAAILANGLYYMAGNGNNSAASGAASTLPNVIATVGVEIATPGQAATTVPQEVGNFSVTSVNDPASGKPYAADKLGKDNNFRGLTIFNNTLYVTKGSGGNGINTVYQVGAAGTLPTVATAAATPITILPGFTTVLAKNTTNSFPFGLFFANANTLYVADEGDGVLANAAGSTTAGIQKWVLSGGTWKLAYVLQNGLNLGQPYTITNYPTGINPATDGIRNITGNVSADGTTATIYGVTSTVSKNGDQGADPNKLVSITDTLAATTLPPSETFTTLRTAVAGEVLRGIAFAPSASIPNAPLILSAASPSVTSIALGGLAFAMGQNLSPDVGEILGPSPTVTNGTSVSITDPKGNTYPAPVIFASPAQVTFQVPSAVAAGLVTVEVTAGSTQTASNVVVAPVAPALFTVNGNGLLAGYAVRVSSSGAQTTQAAYALNAQGSYSASPINMGSATDKVYLTFYATGLTAAGLANVAVSVNGVSVPVLYAGSAGYSGVDQVNVQLPASLAGAGTVALQLTASNIAANTVQIAIQ